ncbi:MAG: DUF4872 domain-containing protein [Deltaproteobacteria bacterium]
MTRDRAFKKIVRARMARTQERYATARAALLGELAKKSPPRAKHDQTFALTRLLAGADAPSEAWLLGLGGGVSFQYHAFAYAGAPPLVYIGTRCNPQYAYAAKFVERALDGLGYEAVVAEATSAKKAERQLLEALEAGPVICWVGREALLGLDAMGGATPWVVVVHDAEDGAAGVEDCRAGAIEVPLERLAAARAAVKKQKHRIVGLGERRAPGDDAVRTAVRQCVADLDGEVVLGGSKKNFGLAALEKWTSLVADDADAKGWPRHFGAGYGLLGGLRQIYAWVHASTDGAGFRPMYAEFLRATKAPALVAAAELVDANGEAWRRLVDDAFTGPPTLGRAKKLLAKGTPTDPRALAALEDEANDALDAAFAAELRGRLHERLTSLLAGERAARDALAAFVEKS